MITKVKDKSYLQPTLNMLKMLGKELHKDGFFIAGGSIWSAFRGLPINDIDIFSMYPRSDFSLYYAKDIIEKAVNLAGFTFKDRRGKLSKFAVNFDIEIDGVPYKVQFISPRGKAQGDPEYVVGNFDIRNVATYIDTQGNVRYLNDHMYNINKRDEYNAYAFNSRYISLGRVQSTFNLWDRIQKYSKRGLELPSEAFQKITQISKALFLQELIEGTYQDSVEGYEAMTLDNVGFTFNEAQYYIKDNAQDVSDILGTPDIVKDSPKVHIDTQSTPSPFNWDNISATSSISEESTEESTVIPSAPTMFRF